MSEESHSDTGTTQSSIATTYADAVVVPTRHVTNVNITATVAEITMTLGQLHSLIDPKTRTLLPPVKTEWFQSLALNPIVAKQMYLGLGRALEFYERQFGKIPEDPSFRLTPDDELLPGRPAV
jgi:hypothetical protein